MGKKKRMIDATIKLPDGTYKIIDDLIANEIEANTIILVGGDINVNSLRAENVVFINSKVDNCVMNAENIVNENVKEESLTTQLERLSPQIN